MLVVRSLPGQPPLQVTSAIENVVREVDPDFESASIVTGAGLRQDRRAAFRDQSLFFGIFGGVILLLTALGIYGVIGLMVCGRSCDRHPRRGGGRARACPPRRVSPADGGDEIGVKSRTANPKRVILQLDDVVPSPCLQNS